MRKNFFQLCVLFLLLCLQTKSFSGGGEGHGGGVDPIFLFRFNAHKLNRFLKNIEKQDQILKGFLCRCRRMGRIYIWLEIRSINIGKYSCRGKP